jgi:hypothetical protein
LKSRSSSAFKEIEDEDEFEDQDDDEFEFEDDDGNDGEEREPPGQSPDRGTPGHYSSPPIVLELELVLVLDPIVEFFSNLHVRSPRGVLLNSCNS